jgi:hypothetical protein
VKYLELNERQTKTRTGTNISDVREVSLKIFENPGDDIPSNFMKCMRPSAHQIFQVQKIYFI